MNLSLNNNMLYGRGELLQTGLVYTTTGVYFCSTGLSLDDAIPVVGGHQIDMIGHKNKSTYLCEWDQDKKFVGSYYVYDRSIVLKDNTRFVTFTIDAEQVNTFKLVDSTTGKFLFENGRIVSEED